MPLHSEGSYDHYVGFRIAVKKIGNYHLDIAATTGRFGTLRDRQIMALSRDETEGHSQTTEGGSAAGGLEGRHGQVDYAQNGVPALAHVRRAVGTKLALAR